MVNLQADASLSVAAAGLTSGLPYVLPWFLDTSTQNLNVAELNVIGTALRADVLLETTATLTAEAIRNAMVDSTMVVTATVPTSDLGRTAQVDATLAISASLQASELRLVNVDAALAVTAGYLGADTVAYDSTGAGATGSLGAAGTKTISWSHTIGPQANCVIVAGVVLIGGATPNVSATCGGTGMTNVGMVRNWDTSPGNYSTVFFMLKNPPTGVQSLSFSSTDGTASYLVANSVAYCNVGSYEFLATNNGNGTSLTQGPLGSSASRMIVQAFSNNTTGVSITGYSQTQRWSQQGVANVNACMMIGDAPGAASVSFAASCATSAKWGAVALSLMPMPVAQVGIGANVTQTATATPTTTYLRNANVDVTQAITASRTGAIVVDMHGNATLPTTATLTGIGVRNAMVDSTIAITASRTANAIWAIYADAPQQITTTTTSNFLRTAQVDVSQQITASPSGTGLRNAIVNATEQITVTPSGDLVVGIKANATESITVTPSGTISYGATGNVTEQITATLSSAGVRNAMVDSALTVTHSTVQFDNATSGSAFGTYGGCPWTHTAQAGATVFVHAASSQGIYNVQYGGVVMTAGYGGWYLTNVPGGPQTVWINTPPATRVTAIAVSYVGTITYGAVTTGSPQTISCAPGEMIVQISDAGGGTSTGGTTRIQVSDGQYYAYTAADSSTSTTFTLSGGTAYVFVLSPRPSVIAGIGANVTEAITATPSAVTTWQAKANVTQAITASPSALGSRGQSLDSTEQITVSPTTVGSRGQTVDATEQITVSPGGVASRWQGFDSPLVITADLAAYLTQQGYSDADLSITVTHPAIVIWDAYTDSYQVVYVYPMGSGYQHSLVFAPLFVTATTDADSTWDTTTGADLLVTTDLPSIGSRGQDIDAPQNITVDLPTVSSLGQTIDADQPIVVGDFDGTIFYGAVGNAPLDITFAPITSDTLLDNHAYAALTVTADRPANVIWDTTADSALIVTSARHGTFGRLLNVDAVLQVMARVAALARGTFGFDAAQAITVVPTGSVSRGQLLDAAQDITITPAGGIVWHGLIRAPLRITATPLGDAIWDAHGDAQLTVTESGLVVPSRGQSIDPALDITVDTSGAFTQTMTGDVEQALLALPDAELSLGSMMDSALSLIVTYSATIEDALRGGNFFYFYL